MIVISQLKKEDGVDFNDITIKKVKTYQDKKQAIQGFIKMVNVDFDTDRDFTPLHFTTLQEIYDYVEKDNEECPDSLECSEIVETENTIYFYLEDFESELIYTIQESEEV